MTDQHNQAAKGCDRHEDCTRIVGWGVIDGQPYAWESHGHNATHVSCRIRNGSTCGMPDGSTVMGAPACAACHAHFNGVPNPAD